MEIKTFYALAHQPSHEERAKIFFKFTFSLAITIGKIVLF
jgi:hypothetical protein